MLRSIVACLLLFPVFAQQPLPNGGELLKRSGDALANYRSYQCDFDTQIEVVVGGNPTQMSVTQSLAVVNPDKKRMETKSQLGETTVVSDGENVWGYVPAIKRYTRKPAMRARQGVLETLGLGDPSASVARSLRQETIEIDGSTYSCSVVEARADKVPQPGGTEMTDVVTTIWIDKDLMIRQITVTGIIRGGQLPGPAEMREKIIVRALKLDVDLPDSLFKFTPPPDAKELPDVPALGSTPNLAGKPAPPLRFKSLAGETFDLASLKGKTVLLELLGYVVWPVSQGDADSRENPHKEFKPNGLVVLGLNVGEQREVVERFLKTANVSYPVAVIDDADITFQVSSIPTYVVIDPDGKVAAYQIGAAGEAALRESLAKAGLKASPPK